MFQTKDVKGWVIIQQTAEDELSYCCIGTTMVETNYEAIKQKYQEAVDVWDKKASEEAGHPWTKWRPQLIAITMSNVNIVNT